MRMTCESTNDANKEVKELLIVIALIGVLAVALLSTINPLEQTRKAKDSSRQAAASELLNSIERFQATFFCYPWSYTTTCAPTETYPQTSISITGLTTVLTTTSAEMKPEFFERDVVTETGTNALVLSVDSDNLGHVCFVPESQTFQSQANKNATGGDGTTHVCIPE
jgi:type II secretory pathway pseudopilin PulG